MIAGELALGGDDGEGKEGTACANECIDQRRGREGVLLWIGQRKSQRDGRVEQKVEGTVEESAAICRRGESGNASVDSVRQAIEQDENNRSDFLLQNDEWDSAKPEQKTKPADLIGPDALVYEFLCQREQGASGQVKDFSVKHSGLAIR